MNAPSNRNKKNKKLFIVISIMAILALGIGYTTYAYVTKQAWPFQQAQERAPADNGINYSPPTEQEVRDSQDGKTSSGEQESQQPTGTISIGIAFAGYDEQENLIDIRAFTPDVIEGDGTCTATLTQGTKTLTRTSKAFIDSSSSQCEPIQIPVADFPSGGTWSLVVNYASAANTGISQQVQVEVSK